MSALQKRVKRGGQVEGEGWRQAIIYRECYLIRIESILKPQVVFSYFLSGHNFSPQNKVILNVTIFSRKKISAISSIVKLYPTNSDTCIREKLYRVYETGLRKLSLMDN